MGYIRHSAIIATAWQPEAADALFQYAHHLGALSVRLAEVTNGYITVLIAPDGSKEEWQESDEGDERRRRIRLWFQQHPDWYFEWCEVAYGDDDANAEIVDHAWREAKVVSE